METLIHEAYSISDCDVNLLNELRSEPQWIKVKNTMERTLEYKKIHDMCFSDILHAQISCISIYAAAQSYRLARKHMAEILPCEGETFITSQYCVNDYVVRDKVMRTILTPNQMGILFFRFISQFHLSGLVDLGCT